MRKKFDTLHTYSEPYARVSTVNLGQGRKSIRLFLSLALVMKYKFVSGERVDLFWEQHNELWNKPILVVKRNGNQRSINAMGRSRTAVFISIKMFVKQFSIPTMGYPLPILDYVICNTGDELWIDFSGEMVTETLQKKYWKSKYGIQKRHTFNFGNGNGKIDVRSNSLFLNQCKIMAKSEGSGLSTLVLRLLGEYMEDKHSHLWYQTVNSMEGDASGKRMST